MPARHNSQKTGRFWAFWTTLPGVLTGVAALITAVVAVVGVLQASGIGTAKSNAGPGQATASAPPLPSAAGNSPGVLAHGRLAMSGGDAANLETGRIDAANSDLNVVGGAGGGQINATNYMALVDGTPDKAACTAALNARHDTYITFDNLPVGSSVCLDTHNDRVAVFQVVSLPAPGNPQLVIDYIVWR